MPEVHDLRSFLQALQAAGQLVTIDEPVDLDFELAEVLQTLELNGGPAALFTRVRGSAMPVVGGLLGDRRRIGVALACEPDVSIERVGQALKQGVPPVSASRGLFLENVLTTSASLEALPIPRHARGDAGPFITAGVVVARDPVTGRQNWSYARFQAKSSRRLGVNINVWRDLRRFLDVAEARGEPLPVALAIGLDPAVMIAAAVRSGDDEIALAGSLRGRPIELARCATIEVEVPAESEIVVEGHIPPGVRELEGPMAEFLGHYTGVGEAPVVEVAAICHRDGAIFQTIVPASYEHRYLGSILPRESSLKEFVQHVSPGITAARLPPYGVGFLAIVAMEKRHPGEPRNVALAALTSHANVKACIVVDPDVDVDNPADILWALATRVDWERDVFTVPRALGHEGDPASSEHGIQTKVGIDATLLKGNKQLRPRVSYPPADVARFLGQALGKGPATAD